MGVEVVFIERIFPHYRKAFFDMLSKELPMKILHGKDNSGIASVSADYSETISVLKYGKKDTNYLLFPLFKILRIRPKIIICDFAIGYLNLPVIILVCKILKIKVAFWSHGYNRQTGFNPKKKIN